MSFEDSDDEVEKKVDLPPYKIRFTDFPREAEMKAIQLCGKAFEKYTLDKDISTQIQKQLTNSADINNPEQIGAWHVIVGKHFASAVTYQTKMSLFFDLCDHHKTILVFKTQ